jgi:hypothetical protein
MCLAFDGEHAEAKTEGARSAWRWVKVTVMLGREY